MEARVKNWTKFQHYKNRCPPWIKLQRSLLDDMEFSRLPIASKALAPLLWLLASESDGTVSTDPARLAFRLRWSEDEIAAGLKPLIDKGFLVVASAPQAPRLQVATPEGEGEGEAKGEEEKTTSPPSAADKPFDFKAELFARWKALDDGGGGAFLNKLFRSHPEERVVEAVEHTLDETRADPKAYVLGVLASRAVVAPPRRDFSVYLRDDA